MVERLQWLPLSLYLSKPKQCEHCTAISCTVVVHITYKLTNYMMYRATDWNSRNEGSRRPISVTRAHHWTFCKTLHLSIIYLQYHGSLFISGRLKLLIKVKFSLCLTKNRAMRTYQFLNYAPRHEELLGSRGRAPGILNFGTRGKRVVSFTPRPLYPREKTDTNSAQESVYRQEEISDPAVKRTPVV